MQAEHSLEEKKRAGDPVDRFGAAHLQITGNTYGSGMSIRYLDLSNYCFLHFECISFNNICTLVGIFHGMRNIFVQYLLLTCQQSAM